MYVEAKRKQQRRTNLPKAVQQKLKEYKSQTKEAQLKGPSLLRNLSKLRSGTSDNAPRFGGFALLTSWVPHKPTLDQLFAGHPHPNPKAREKHARKDCSTDHLVSADIVGSGLCIFATASGQVSLFNFATGDRLFRLNTDLSYTFPKAAIKQAIFLNVNKISRHRTLPEDEADMPSDSSLSD
jgi:hypothetical protein